jgi:hypothetical protein
MYSQVLGVSFRFTGWDGLLYDVESECHVRWDEAWDEGGRSPLATSIHSMELVDPIVNDEALTWHDARLFSNKYYEDFRDALEWIVINSIVSPAS